MAKKRFIAPRLREQFKDNAHEVVKNIEYKKDVNERELRVREAEYESNPKKGLAEEHAFVLADTKDTDESQEG